MSTLVVSVSMSAEVRRRLSCGSWLRHTLQLQPTTGTPHDVPVPKNVSFISIASCDLTKTKINPWLNG